MHVTVVWNMHVSGNKDECHTHVAYAFHACNAPCIFSNMRKEMQRCIRDVYLLTLKKSQLSCCNFYVCMLKFWGKLS